MDRYIKDVSEITSYKVDYDSVRSNINHYRERSFNWLKKALELWKEVRMIKEYK